MKKQFTLNESQFERLLNASKPTPAMWLSGGQPMFDSPQENANRVWKELGQELGFVWDSAEPIQGEPQNTFTAEAL